jgi:hypothetical protein
LKKKGIEAAPQSLSCWLIKKGFSFKKPFGQAKQGRPELLKARAEWKVGLLPLMYEQQVRLIFIDETGTTTKLDPPARALSERLNSRVPFGH